MFICVFPQTHLCMSKSKCEERADSTRPLDSTRYFETAQGIKTYSEVSEILAASVTKTIGVIIDKTPEDIHITPEWICQIHNDIAGTLFPDWAGRFRDINVEVGTHITPPYYEVPVHVRLYYEDLTATTPTTTPYHRSSFSCQ